MQLGVRNPQARVSTWTEESFDLRGDVYVWWYENIGNFVEASAEEEE